MVGARILGVGVVLTLVSIGPNVAHARRPDGVAAQQRTGEWCGTPQPVQSCGDNARNYGHGPQARRVIFLNRNGGTYTPGAITDATLNSVAAIDIQTGTIPPLVGADPSWQAVVDCVKAYYDPYNVDIVTDEPPADSLYQEVVVGGTQDDVHYSNPLFDVYGVAANDDFCQVASKGIAFAFAAAHPPIDGSVFGQEELCITIAHEAGHLVGLEHEVIHNDLMSYESGHDKDFRDQDSPCGTYEAQPHQCSCGADGMQNSARVLYDLLGPNEQVPPELTVDSPGDGQSVPPGFKVTGSATDDVELSRVDLVIDGEQVAFDDHATFTLTAPSNLALGAHTVVVRALDKAANVDEVTLALTVEPACTGTGQGNCEDGEECVDGACLTALGGSCGTNADCASGTCFTVGQFDRVCSQTCSASDSCPSGFTCEQGVGTGHCLEGGGGGGCLVAAGGRDGGGGTAGAIGALCFIVIFSWRRRARAR